MYEQRKKQCKFITIVLFAGFGGIFLNWGKVIVIDRTQEPVTLFDENILTIIITTMGAFVGACFGLAVYIEMILPFITPDEDLVDRALSEQYPARSANQQLESNRSSSCWTRLRLWFTGEKNKTPQQERSRDQIEQERQQELIQQQQQYDDPPPPYEPPTEARKT